MTFSFELWYSTGGWFGSEWLLLFPFVFVFLGEFAIKWGKLMETNESKVTISHNYENKCNYLPI